MSTEATSSVLRHITWDQLQSRIREGVPFVHRIPAPTPSVPALDIRISEGGRFLALWLPYSADDPPITSPLTEIDINIIQGPGGKMIEIRTGTESLFQELYSFFVSIIDKVQLNGANPSAALEETIDGWRELLKARVMLSEEAQLGLRGELKMLRLLITLMGEGALLAWTGPQKQPHDFRFGRTEIEVKATRGSRHCHMINGLSQLEPSPGHVLYVFSLCFAPAGAEAGSTLAEDIHITQTLLSNVGRERFAQLLRDHFKYKAEHAPYYKDALQIANQPLLVPVDGACPRLTRTLLSTLPHHAQIDDVRYRADFEGLGFSQDDPRFRALFN